MRSPKAKLLLLIKNSKQKMENEILFTFFNVSSNPQLHFIQDFYKILQFTVCLAVDMLHHHH